MSLLVHRTCCLFSEGPCMHGRTDDLLS